MAGWGQYVTIADVECRKVTDTSMLVIVEDEEYWLPLSQIDEEGSEIRKKGDIGELRCTAWIAAIKGII